MDARQAMDVVTAHALGLTECSHPQTCEDLTTALATLKELVPKRYEVGESSIVGPFIVSDTKRDGNTTKASVAHRIPTPVAAERIAAIYEEVTE